MYLSLQLDMNVVSYQKSVQNMVTLAFISRNILLFLGSGHER